MLRMHQKARKIWQDSRYPPAKNELGMINKEKQKYIRNFLDNFNPDVKKEYSLWKATEKFKGPIL